MEILAATAIFAAGFFIGMVATFITVVKALRKMNGMVQNPKNGRFQKI